MTVPQETTVYDITDCKIFPIVTDLVAGPSPTYGAAIDVPLIATAQFDPDVVSTELYGDGGRLGASKAKIRKFTVKLGYGKFSAPALAATLGGLVTPGAAHTDFDLQFGAQLPPFGLALEIPDVDDEAGIGDLHAYFYKARVATATLLNQQTDQFGQPTLDANVYPPFSQIGQLPESSGGRSFRTRLWNVDTPITVML